jgi:hypothetical protein
MPVISVREVRLTTTVGAVIFSFLCISCLFVSDFVIQGLCTHHACFITGPALGTSKARASCGHVFLGAVF